MCRTSGFSNGVLSLGARGTSETYTTGPFDPVSGLESGAHEVGRIAVRGHRNHRWVLTLGLSSLAMVVGLGVAEVALRISGLAPPKGLFTATEGQFRRIPGTFAPGQRAVLSEGTPFEHRATINRLGYRGPEMPALKPDGQLRILFAGDSFTWGHNVDDTETTPLVLQRFLAERCTQAAVANAGFPGSTILAHQAIIERGLSIDPDLVVLMYHENDIDELIYPRRWTQLASNRRIKSAFPVSVAYPLVRKSALWSTAQHVRRVFQNRGATSRMPTMQHSTPREEDVVRALDEYRERLEATRDTVRLRGSRLLFGTFPHPRSVEAGEGGRDYEAILAIARNLDLPTIDLLPDLMRGPLSVADAYLVPEDYHPSPSGHRLAARVIADRILQEMRPEACNAA